MKPELRREFARKAFHMLSLVYLAGYHALGAQAAVRVMAAWLAACLVIETARLRVPVAERFLTTLFSGLMRETERRHYSGIVHTTAGCLLAMLLAGGDAVIVTAAILQLAFADAAAALAGKAWGRTRLFGGVKTLEGSAAGFLAGLACALGAGAPPAAAAASAMAVSCVELLPTTGWFNDNLSMPVAGALVLRLFSPL